MNTTYYIGLDVHKESIAIAHTPEGSREEALYYGTCGGSIQSVERTLRKVAKKLGVEFRELKVCYEAGPTGFVLARRLIHLGVECTVIAPTTTERKPNEKIKTDKRDARKLAKILRNGDVTAVRIPPASDEAVRDPAKAGSSPDRRLAGPHLTRLARPGVALTPAPPSPAEPSRHSCR